MNNKTVGHLIDKYWHDICDPSDIPEIKKVIKEFVERAKEKEQPVWYIKNAALYLIWKDDKCYCIYPGHLKTTQEIFECVVDDLIDRLYELGAYDMFYSGMMD